MRIVPYFRLRNSVCNFVVRSGYFFRTFVLLLFIGSFLSACGGGSGDPPAPNPNPVVDSDSDGVPDEDDAFPNDPDETLDSDGDTVGDNGDAFPNDPSETVDTDMDGVGDNADEFPEDPDRTGIEEAVWDEGDWGEVNWQ